MADVQVPSGLVKSILAPLLQPGANLQQTQTEIPNIQQQTATSAQEQQNLSASNPGIQAQSKTQQVQATQNAASLVAGNAIQKGMSLHGAIQTFGALGVKADDVFQKYLSNSPNGFPHESLTQLKNYGISDAALGKVGDLSSFADRQNMRNAVGELRSLQDTFNNTSTLAKLPLGNVFGSGKVYEGQRQLVGQHLASLIQGAPQAASSAQGLMSAIPASGDMAQLQSGEANQQFAKAEQTLLQSKGYSYQDLGLTPPGQTASQAVSQLTNGVKQRPNMKGGELLQNILNDTKNIGANTVNTGSEYLNKILSGENPSTATGDMAVQLGKGAVQNYANILGIQNKNGQLSESPNAALQYITQHPVTTALSALPFLAGKGGAVTDTGEAAAEAPPKTQVPKTPIVKGAGNTVMDFIAPGRAISKAGDARTANIQAATKANIISKGNDVANTALDKLNKLKMATQDKNDEEAIDNATNSVIDKYGDKTFTPTQLKGFYDSIQDPYTKGGAVRTPIQASIDKITKDSISETLDKDIPGWQSTTARMAKGFKTQKSGGRAIAGRVVPAALGLAGLDEIRKILGVTL